MKDNTLPLFTQPKPSPPPAPSRADPPARARRTDPATSQQAADQVNRNNKAWCNRELIMGVLKDHRGQWLTAGQIAYHLKANGIDHVEVCRRLPELKKRGDAESGEAKPCPIRHNNMRGWRYVKG